MPLSGNQQQDESAIRRLRAAMRGRSWSAQAMYYATAKALGVDYPENKASYDANAAAVSVASDEKSAIDTMVAAL